VRGAASQLSERLHLLRVRQPLFELALGVFCDDTIFDVATLRNQQHDRASRVVHWLEREVHVVQPAVRRSMRGFEANHLALAR